MGTGIAFDQITGQLCNWSASLNAVFLHALHLQRYIVVLLEPNQILWLNLIKKVL